MMQKQKVQGEGYKVNYQNARFFVCFTLKEILKLNAWMNSWVLYASAIEKA